MAWSGWTRGVEIEPSVYAADFLRLGEQVEALLGAGARIFHVDVGDGRFIPPVTIGPVVVEALAPLVRAVGGRLDCHLMVDDPAGQIPLIAEAGGDSVTFHVEAAADPDHLIELARAHGLGVGIALKPVTPIDEAARFTAGADLVLCMSVDPGYSGQQFISASLERVGRLRSLLDPDVLVQVDGGLFDGNVGAVREAGADLIVAGSAVFGAPDPAAAYRGLVEAVG